MLLWYRKWRIKSSPLEAKVNVWPFYFHPFAILLSDRDSCLLSTALSIYFKNADFSFSTYYLIGIIPRWQTTPNRRSEKRLFFRLVRQHVISSKRFSFSGCACYAFESCNSGVKRVACDWLMWCWEGWPMVVIMFNFTCFWVGSRGTSSRLLQTLWGWGSGDSLVVACLLRPRKVAASSFSLNRLVLTLLAAFLKKLLECLILDFRLHL